MSEPCKYCGYDNGKHWHRCPEYQSDADLEKELADVRQENQCLKAEVERLKLKWQSGPHPQSKRWVGIQFQIDYPNNEPFYLCRFTGKELQGRDRLRYRRSHEIYYSHLYRMGICSGL